MYPAIPLLLAALFPPQSRIKLPPPKPPKVQEQNQTGQQGAELTPLDSFRRDLMQLAAARGRADLDDALLRKMAQDYRELDELILQAARQIGPEQMTHLMKVARRYGSRRLGEELLFQLQVRPLGDATEEVVETMVVLLGDAAKEALFYCVNSRFTGLRRSAVARLESRVGPEDLAFAVELSRERKLDLVQAGVSLLGAIRTPEARARLMELLSGPPVVAVEACQALIEHRSAAVPDLQAMLTRPPVDRSFGYAAIALVALEEATGRELLTDDMLAGMVRELRGPDDLQRTMVAVALAEVIHRSGQQSLPGLDVTDVVEALLAVVSPTSYVPNLSILREPAEKRLELLTGRESPERHVLWRSWWQEVREDFVGIRRRLEVTQDNARLAQVTLDQGGWRYRLRGEDLQGGRRGQGRIDLILSGEQMHDLVRGLESLGFMAPGIEQSIRTPLPNTRSLELTVGGARSRLAAPAESPRYDRMAELVLQLVESEKWQLYHTGSDPRQIKAFWEAERRWLEEHPDRKDRDVRLIDLIAQAWPTLPDEESRALGLQHLLAIPSKQEILSEEHGVAFVELALAGDRLTPVRIGLLEFALASPGDRVWRRVLDALDEHYDTGGREALPRVFSILGADRVVEAVTDGRRRIRLAAMDELVQLRDLRAVPALVEMLRDDDPVVQRSAIFTLGMLRTSAARQPLIDLVIDQSTPATLRREGLVALGRVGGSEVPGLLSSALASPVPEDREAAVRGLGELNEPAATPILAQVFVIQPTSPLGALARFSLQKHGAIRSVPALRQHLGSGDPEVQRQVVLLLGEFLDPKVIPELVAMLEQEGDQLQVVGMLEGITGLELVPYNDRITMLRDWYRVHRDQPQYVWLLDALEAAQIETSLTREQLILDSGAKAVPELARILVEAEQSRLRMLASAVLREVTGQDYGTVSAQTPRSRLESIAVRYRYLADAREQGGIPQ